jgi:hypothetical protein
MKEYVNERGNNVRGFNEPDIDRYAFDFRLCTSEDGWQQYDTDQDAWYFGNWVHAELRRIVTYCEGDVSIVDCPSEESFKAELAHMAQFYGEPPPAFIVYSTQDDGSVTRQEFYDERPA